MHLLARTALITMAALVAMPAMATTVVTGSAGGGQPVSNYQPSLVLSQVVQSQGIFPRRDIDAGAGAVMGMVRTFAWDFGTPKAQGQLIPISQNTALFSILGTTYGGDGRTTFALPDLVGRTVVGAGQGPGLSVSTLGEFAGSASISLTAGNMPAHVHSLPSGGVTSVAGGNQPFDNEQPSLALNYMIQAEGIYPSPSGPQAGDPSPYFIGGSAFIGQVGVFAGNFQPGWMFADGRLLPIDQYTALFSLIGTTYGGDGQTTFALPDLRGRVARGTGQGPGLSNIALGETGGAENTSLTALQLPNHDHDLPGGGTTGATGGNQPVSNEQPYLGMNYAIALQGIFPARDRPLGEDVYIGEVIQLAGNFAPRGYALANGQLLSIAQNQALFALLGTTFGGDGRTTFALPDLRGRIVVGSGNGFDIGQKFGAQTFTLTEANLPPHTHSFEVKGGVPEPASWAMMLAGFGIVGGALRRRVAVRPA